MSKPKMPKPQVVYMPTPNQTEAETSSEMQAAEQTRKQQISNMQGRRSTIATSELGDTDEVLGFKVSLLGGA